MGAAASAAEFLETRVKAIPGWLEDYTGLRTMDLLHWQETNAVRGPLFEIGVYAGRYFSILLRSAAATKDKAVGLDTFQWVDEPTVRSHLAKAVAYNPILVKGSSTNCTAPELLAVLASRPRFVSIDGSHEKSDVFWDLRLAEELLSPKGIVAVDDFLNPIALGVNEAAHLFFLTPRALVPIAYVANKLFLSRPGMAAEYKQVLEKAIDADPKRPRSIDFAARRSRGRHEVEQQLWGHAMLVVP